MAALRRRLDADSRAPVAVALSGGGDSLALLVCALQWASLSHRPVLALTVDHGLHADSARWTADAGAMARRLGANWRALTWRGPKPRSGLPAAARQARHSLLAEATRALGARVLLLGHTAGDVAESQLIRAHTPSHGYLDEWSPSPVWPQGRDVFLLRPLLALHRCELQAWLKAQGLAWLEDPGNADPRFARTHARLALANRCAPPPPPPRSSPDTPPRSRLHIAGGSHTSGRDGGFEPSSADEPDRGGVEVWDAPAVWRDRSGVDAWGAAGLNLVHLLNAATAKERLAKALSCVAGLSTPPSGAGLHRLLARLAEGEAFTATLGGARLEAKAGRLRLTRELGRLRPKSSPLTVGAVQVFDGRFELEAQAPGWRVAPLAGLAATLPRSEREGLRAAAAAARPSLPVLLDAEGRTQLPAPFGNGPATARLLVADRLAAAWGLFSCESALGEAAPPTEPRSAARALILS